MPQMTAGKMPAAERGERDGNKAALSTVPLSLRQGVAIVLIYPCGKARSSPLAAALTEGRRTYEMAVAPVGKNPLSPLPWMIPDRSSPSRVRFRRFAPWTVPGRSEEMAVYEGKGGFGPCGRAEREPFGHTSRLEPPPRGAVTRRAVAQRRSRGSGLTHPLAEAIRGF